MTARNERLRERQKALGLEPVQTVLHPDDKAALLEYAYQLRVKRGTLTPTDIKRVNDVAIDDLPAPADSQILADSPVQTNSVDPTIAQTKIDGVVAVVARWDNDAKTKNWLTTGRSWEKGFKLLTEIKEALS